LKWFPPFAKENPIYSNFSDEAEKGTFNSVVTLCERDSSLVKKFSKDFPFYIMAILLFMAPLLRTTSVSSTS
jgi:hypothetical protein